MNKYVYLLLSTLFIVSSLFGWEKYSGNPVLSPGPLWCNAALSDPDIIFIPGGGFFLVFTAGGYDSIHGETLTRPGAAWSPNGFDWTMSSGPVMTNGEPGTWDSAAVETPAVLFDSDSIILVYVGDWAHGAWEEMALGIASSNDGGTTFSRLTDSPILENDTTRPEEHFWIESPTLLRIGDSLIMWYNSISLDGQIVVCRASSYDGIEWNRYPGNPVMEGGETGEFDEAGVYSPCVRQIGDSLCMLYQGFMWNHVCDTCWLNFDTAYIGWATSVDKGITWTRCPDNPVLGSGPEGSWDAKGTITPSFCVNGNLIIAFYWNGGFDTIPPELGIATNTLNNIAEYRNADMRISLSAYPNPFNSSCEITIDGVGTSRPVGTPLQVEIYDLRGNVVATPFGSANAEPLSPLSRGTVPPLRDRGVYIWTPDKNIPSGIYFVRAKIDNGSMATKRIIYIR